MVVENGTTLLYSEWFNDMNQIKYNPSSLNMTPNFELTDIKAALDQKNLPPDMFYMKFFILVLVQLQFYYDIK